MNDYERVMLRIKLETLFNKAMKEKLQKEAQEVKYTKCTCGDPTCTFLVFDNGFKAPENREENVVYVDFTKKKKL